MGEHLNEKNGGARREFPVVECKGGSVEKYQAWNGNGCGEILEPPPPVCVLGVGDLNEIVCGRECVPVWVHRVVYVGKRFQWVMGGGYRLYFGGAWSFCLEEKGANVVVQKPDFRPPPTASPPCSDKGLAMRPRTLKLAWCGALLET